MSFVCGIHLFLSFFLFNLSSLLLSVAGGGLPWDGENLWIDGEPVQSPVWHSHSQRWAVGCVQQAPDDAKDGGDGDPLASSELDSLLTVEERSKYTGALPVCGWWWGWEGDDGGDVVFFSGSGWTRASAQVSGSPPRTERPEAKSFRWLWTLIWLSVWVAQPWSS